MTVLEIVQRLGAAFLHGYQTSREAIERVEERRATAAPADAPYLPMPWFRRIIAAAHEGGMSTLYERDVIDAALAANARQLVKLEAERDAWRNVTLQVGTFAPVHERRAGHVDGTDGAGS